MEPGISVVPQEPWEIGRRAAEQLFRRIEGDRGGAVQDVLVSRVTARGSGEIPPRA